MIYKNQITNTKAANPIKPPFEAVYAKDRKMIKRNIKAINIAYLLFGLMSSSLWATDYYCDPDSGNIGNNGLTPETAWPSLATTWDAKVGSTVVSGDTIKLMNGYNGAIDENQTFTGTADITIEPADGHTASLGRFVVEGGEYWYLKDLLISPETDGVWNKVGVGGIVKLITHGTYGEAHHNTIDGCTIYSRWNPTDWTLQEWSENCDPGIKIGTYGTVKNCMIKIVSVAITGSNHNTIQNNTITYFTADGINGISSYSIIEYNLIQGVVDYAPAGAHHDAIQMGSGNMANLIIRGNRVINLLPGQTIGVGNTQGINCFEKDYTHTNWLIENNLVLVNHTHGMTFSNISDSNVVNNTVIKWPTGSNIPGIRLTDGGTNNNIINNISHTWYGNGGGLNTNNFDIDNYTMTDEFVDYNNYDIHLKATSNFINVGTTTQAPSIDCDQNPRDSSPDVGAYEYQGKYFIVIKE